MSENLVASLTLVVALAGFFLFRKERSLSPTPVAPLTIGVGFAIVIAVLASRFAPALQGVAVAGVLSGLLLVAVSTALGQWPAAVSVALGTLSAGLCLFLPAPSLVGPLLGLLVGLGLGLIACPSTAGERTAAVAAAIGLSTALGTFTTFALPALTTTVLLGIGSAVGAMVIASIRTIPAWVNVLVVGVVSAAIAKLWLGRDDALPPVGLATVAALAVHFLLDDESPEAIRFMLASVIWVAVGTLAFSFSRGYGISLALTTGAVALAATGNGRGILAMGPMFGIVLYRLFRELYPEVSRALDIGQHYAIIGLLAGALVPALRPLAARATAVLALCAGVAYVVFPSLLSLILAAKGTVGLLIGLGLAPVLHARESAPGTLGVSVGLGGLAIAAFGSSLALEEMTRDQKIVSFSILAGVLLAVGIVAALASRGAKATEVKA